MGRKELGQQRLGAPIGDTFNALIAAVDEKSWADFSTRAGRLLFQQDDRRVADQADGWRPLRQKTPAVAPEDVKVVTLLLFRDMFRHTSGVLRPQTNDTLWVEPLFKEIATGLGLSPARLQDDGRPYEIGDIDDCGWATLLAAPFGFPAEKLFACHSAIVGGVREEFAA